jgi:hypothetical protein
VRGILNAYFIALIKAIVILFRYFHAYLHSGCGVKVISIVGCIDYFFGNTASFYCFSFVCYILLDFAMIKLVAAVGSKGENTQQYSCSEEVTDIRKSIGGALVSSVPRCNVG